MSKLAAATAAVGATPSRMTGEVASWRIASAHAHGAQLLAAAAIDRLDHAGIEYAEVTGPIPTRDDVACWLSVRLDGGAS